MMKRVLLFFALVIPGVVLNKVYAHQAPYSIAYLDISPDRVGVELHIPLSELQLAYGNALGGDAATLVERMGPQLKEYLMAHTHAFVSRDYPWLVEVQEIFMDSEEQSASGPRFRELRARMLLKPQRGESTRHFFFDYDGVVHQVVNHIIFVAVRSDWETGRSDSLTADGNPMTIRTAGDNTIHPLEITLAGGSRWSGFGNMVGLGMEHIRTGTDHLLFLIVLLLPAMLAVSGKKMVVVGGMSVASVDGTNVFVANETDVLVGAGTDGRVGGETNVLVASGKKWGSYKGWRPTISSLLKIVTAFTIGHSVTLLIGAMGWLRVPSQPVEVLIAVSILVSAVHAVTPLFPGRELFVAGGFGLVHGLAFAGVLANMNLAGGTLAMSVLGFNLGIEAMQLIVMMLVIPWFVLLSRTRFYPVVRIGGAVLAATAALGWIVERA